MKKILCFFIAMLMVFALALSVFADTELKGNINLARIEYLKAFLDYSPNNAIS